MKELTPTLLTDTAHAELSTAVDAISAGGDEMGTIYADTIKQLIGEVLAETGNARARAAQLHGDHMSNPVGVAEQLAEIPGRLSAATADKLTGANEALKVIERAHLEGIRNPDLPEGTGIRDELRRNDANASTREDLHNYAEGMTPSTAVQTLLWLAADARYSSAVVGTWGDSIVNRFAIKDASMVKNVALRTLKEKGSPGQRRHIAALDKLAEVKRVIELAREGVRNAADETQRPPRPAPTQAMR